MSEVTNLTKADFSYEDGQLYIDIKNAKWRSDRRIPVVDRKAAQVVGEYVQSLDVTSQPAFRMSKRTLQTYATNFTKRYGIPFHCHVLRHTFATLLMEQGVTIEKIQYLLGHQSATMTRHYTQSAFVDVSKVTVSFNENLGTSVV